MAKNNTSLVKTGISGFDRLVEGGFPRGKSILLSGTPGTGKTIFALQYLYNGAVKYNEKGLYVSFEEKTSNLQSQAMQFNWDFEKLEEQGMVKLLSIPPTTIKETTPQDILNLVKRENFQRVVIDSLSALSINVPTTYSKISDVTDFAIKRFIYHFITNLRQMQDITPLLISQTADGELSRDGVSEFVCDGIIRIEYEALGGEFSRHLQVRKMREVHNNEELHSVEISKNGIVLHEFK